MVILSSKIFHLIGRFIRAILSFCLIVVVSLLALEWLVRMLLPGYHPAGQISFIQDNGVPLAQRNFDGRLWKNTGDYNVEVKINRYGFRDKKDLSASSASDIFVLGDSFTFGWGVEETERFSNQFEKLSGLPTYNIAIPTDFNGYARLIEHARKNGAIINRLVIGVCMENDLHYYHPAPPLPPVAHHRPLPLSRAQMKLFLSEYSAIYGAVTSVIHQNLYLQSIMIRFGLITENIAGMSRNSYVPEIITNSAVRLQRLITESKVEQSLILLIPSRGLWVGGREEIEQRVHTEFAAALTDSGLNLIDLQPFFEKQGDPLNYHFNSDGHWNVAGHTLAAEALHAYEVEHKLFRDSSN